MTSERERIAHVFRRLGVGTHPDLVAGTVSVAEAIERSLDLTGPSKATQQIRTPQSWGEVYEVIEGYEPVVWWVEAMTTDTRLVEERMVWFWHDHFAVSADKVDHPYAMWRYIGMLRNSATGNFSELLRAVAREPAMLAYLDGLDNTVWGANENFAREVMELHTLGVGHYAQPDIVEGARSFTGWTVNDVFYDDDGNEQPGRFARDDLEPWSSYFEPDAHDDGIKQFLGRSGRFDMNDAVDILLDHPRTATFVAGKLYRHLAGFDPEDDVLTDLADRFRADYEILPLVRDIAGTPGFTSDAAIRSKVRTPVEKVVALLQAFPKVQGITDEEFGWGLVDLLGRLGYVPFLPPNPAGFPDGGRLIGPGQLSESFALLQAIERPPDDLSTDDILNRLALIDVSSRTRRVLDDALNTGLATALAFGSPEFLLT